MIFALASLATWRIAHILVYEDGPFDVFDKTRQAMGSVPALYKLINCLKCVSVWVGAVFSLAISTNLPEFVLYTFALSGAAILLDEIIGKLER